MKQPTKAQAAVWLLGLTALYLADILIFGVDSKLFVYGSVLYAGTASVIIAFLLGFVRPD